MEDIDMKEKEQFTITTTCLENYGAHNDTGKFKEGHNYWKFKCGSTYIVEGLDRLSDAVAFIASIVTHNTIHYKEIISDYQSGVPNDYNDFPHIILNVNNYMNSSKKEREKMMSKTLYPSTWQYGYEA